MSVKLEATAEWRDGSVASFLRLRRLNNAELFHEEALNMATVYINGPKKFDWYADLVGDSGTAPTLAEAKAAVEAALGGKEST